MATAIFKDFIFEAFMQFQRDTKKHSVTAFADYLSKNNSVQQTFSQQIVSGWLNGEFKPSEKYAPALAEVLGDEIYQMLGFEPPDPKLQRLNQIWYRIPEKVQLKLLEEGERYAAETNQPDTDTEPVRNTK